VRKEELRGQIARLSERLAKFRAEERLSRLVITRETVDEVLSEAGGPASSAAAPPDGTGPSRFGRLSPVGVLTVPPRRPGSARIRRRWRACGRS
jgi:hypothetical protein